MNVLMLIVCLRHMFYMKIRHVEKLLISHPLGILIKFEHNLQMWQQSQLECNTTTDNVINDPEMVASGNSISNKGSNSSEKSIHEMVNVYSILTNCTEGKLLVEYFKTNNELNDSIRGK